MMNWRRCGRMNKRKCGKDEQGGDVGRMNKMKCGKDEQEKMLE
jgi:hypothetical protein